MINNRLFNVRYTNIHRFFMHVRIYTKHKIEYIIYMNKYLLTRLYILLYNEVLIMRYMNPVIRNLSQNFVSKNKSDRKYFTESVW